MSTVNQEGGNALADYALRRSRTDPFWEIVSADPNWSDRRRGGSLNLMEIRHASGLAWIPAERETLEASWLTLDRDMESKAWGGSEILSPIYQGWRMLSRLGVYRWARENGRDELAESVARWLRQAFAFCRLVDCHVNGVGSFLAMAGLRGCEPDSLMAQFIRGSIWREAKGERWPGSEGADPSRWDRDDINQWADVAVRAFSPEIRELAAPFVSCDWRVAFDLCPQMPLGVVYNIIRTEGGVVSWIGDDDPATDDDPNNNTPGLLAEKVETGKGPESLPPDGGPHYRQRASFASCELVDGVLHYHSDAPELGVSSMRLPPGRTIYRVRASSGWSWYDGESQVPAINETPPPTPDAPPVEDVPPANEATPPQTGAGIEIMPGEIPGKWVVAWPGRARVLPFRTQDDRALVVLDHDGDPT